MLERLLLSIVRRPWKQIRMVLLYAVLFFFLLGASLIPSISSLFDTAVGQSIDLRVTVFPEFVEQEKSTESDRTDLEDEKQWFRTLEELGREKGVLSSDYQMSASNLLLNVGSIDQNNQASYYEISGDSAPKTDPDWVFHPFARTSFTAITGVSTSDPEILKKGQIALRGQAGGRFFSAEEIENGEMVCVIPARHIASLSTPQGFVSQVPGDELNLIACAYDSSGHVTASKTWALKIVGVNQGNASDTVISDNVVYLPVKALEKIEEEVLAFLQEKQSSLSLDNMKLTSQRNTLTPAVFELDNLEHMKCFLDHLHTLPAWQEGRLSTDSSLDEYAPVLSNIYSVTSSFRMIALLVSLMIVLFAAVTGALECMYRRREMAVLQAMGESGMNISVQFAIEQGLQMAAGLCLALPAALFGVRKFAGFLFDNSVKETSEAISQALSTSFSLQKIEWSEADISTLVNYSGSQLLLCLSVIVLCVLSVLLVSRAFAGHFQARSLLGGDGS